MFSGSLWCLAWWRKIARTKKSPHPSACKSQRLNPYSKKVHKSHPNAKLTIIVCCLIDRKAGTIRSAMGAATRTICAIMTGCEKILWELADTFVIADTGNGIDRGAAQVFETCVRG